MMLKMKTVFSKKTDVYLDHIYIYKLVQILLPMVVIFSVFSIFEGFQASWYHAISKHGKMKMQLFCLNNDVQYFRKAYSCK